MAETFGFYDAEELVDGSYDREYVAQQWADYFKLFIGTGVFASPTNQLKVVAGEGMNIIVKEGWAFIQGRWYHNDSDLVLAVQPNTTASTVTSGVFIQADSSDRAIRAIVATGRTTPDRESPFYELELAQIQLATGTTAITNAMITDMRTDESVCGFVKGLLEGVIPTADLFLQFQTQFNTWFEQIRGQLDEDAAGHLQNEIDDIRKRTITNMLNPTFYSLTTRTLYGVDITNNGDGTFTVNGTTTDYTGSTDGYININLTPFGDPMECGECYTRVKLCGTPASVAGKARIQLADSNDSNIAWHNDTGNGFEFNTIDNKVTIYALRLGLLPNTVYNNVTFKPMLTDDLFATYNDYVQYSGGGNINEDVVNLFQLMPNISYNGNRVKNISFVLEGNTLNITTS